MSFLAAIKADVQLVLIVACFAFAWWRGGGPELACASVLLSMPVADKLYHAIAGEGAFFTQIDVGHFAIDIVTAALFVAIALYANRIYPLCLASFQLVAVLSHFVREISETMAPLAYSIMIVAPSYLELFVIFAAIILHMRRSRKFGRVRDWRQPSVV